MAQKTFEDLIPKRNQAVFRRHRREVFWQVSFPFGLGLVLLLGTCALTVGAAAGGTSVALWRDVSMIWILAPAMLFALIPLVLLAAAAAGVFKLISVLPEFFFKLQRFFETVAIRTSQVSLRVASPMIGVRSWWAGLERLWRALR